MFSNIWDLIWSAFLIFAFVAYLVVLFSIISDIFRDHKLGGWGKAIWVIFLIWIPFLTALVYLITRGRSMSERQQHAVQHARDETDAYIRSVAPASPVADIAKGKELLDSGAITAAEYEALKAKALR